MATLFAESMIFLKLIGQKFRRNLQDFGWTTTIKKSGAYMLSPVYRQTVYRFHRTNIAHCAPLPEITLPAIQFELVDACDMRLIAQIEGQAEWLQGKLQRRLQAGDFCVVALCQDQVVGLNLIAFGTVSIALLRLKRTFRCDTAWSDYITVRKAYRTLGLATELRRRVIEELKRRGVKTLYGGALASNTPSLTFARRVGAEEFARVEYRKMLNHATWTVSRIRKQRQNDLQNRPRDSLNNQIDSI